MTTNIFLIMVALVLVLVAIGLSSYWGRHWGMPSGADDDYYYALRAATAQCGQNARFLGLLMKRAITTYSFTRGNCGTGIGSEEVDIDRNTMAHSYSDPLVQKQSEPVFGRMIYNLNYPISLPDWKISSQRAFQILSQNDEPQSLNDAGDSASLQLIQRDSSLIWLFSEIKGGAFVDISINASTGLVVGKESVGIRI